jgi:urease accessory protein
MPETSSTRPPEAIANGPISLLASLQQSDSFFPGGAMAFSWGLEGLMRDALVTDATTLLAFVESQALSRWASLDQGLMCGAWRAGDAFDVWHEVDALAEAMSLPPALRNGSRRLGRTLADVHARLGSETANRIRDAISAGRTPGHLATVQGAVWRSLGIAEEEARAISAHMTCTGSVSSAVRLGIVGHLDAQRVLTLLRAPLARVLAQPAPPLDDLHAATFAADIAALRSQTHDARLFAN